MQKKIEPLVDEGLRVSLVETAFFDGDLEIPHINAPESIIIPDGLVPLNNMDYQISPILQTANISKRILMVALENLEITMKQAFQLLKLATILKNL